MKVPVEVSRMPKAPRRAETRGSAREGGSSRVIRVEMIEEKVIWGRRWRRRKWMRRRRRWCWMLKYQY